MSCARSMWMRGAGDPGGRACGGVEWNRIVRW